MSLHRTESLRVAYLGASQRSLYRISRTNA